MTARNYSLFEQREGKWVRISDLAMPRPSAVRVFQNSLLAGVFSGKRRELRVVKDAPADVERLCLACRSHKHAEHVATFTVDKRSYPCECGCRVVRQEVTVAAVSREG